MDIVTERVLWVWIVIIMYFGDNWGGDFSESWVSVWGGDFGNTGIGGWVGSWIGSWVS